MATHTLESGFGTTSQHESHIHRAQKSGYLHQRMHTVSGLTRKIVDTVPAGTGLYLIGEGKVVHAFDPMQVAAKNIRIVTVDRSLPDAPPNGVDAQIWCDLNMLAADVRASIANVRLLPVPSGAFMASHIGRYLPADTTSTLLHAGADALVDGGSIWLVDTPIAARAKKTGGSPGFHEAYELTRTRDDVRIAVDVVLAPRLDIGLYYQLNELRAQRPGADDLAFFEAVDEGKIQFDTVVALAADEHEFRVNVGRRAVRVNGWGIRAMMLQKQE